MPRPIQVGRKERMTFAKINEVCEMPNLIQIQTDSYNWFIEEGLREVFEDISPIKDYADNLVLEFIDYSISDSPKYEQEECKERDVTYAAPLKVKVRLINKETGEVKEQEIFMGDFPLMTDAGTFVINGAERVIVSQLVRSPGVYFGASYDKTGKHLYTATMNPNRGAWLEYETDGVYFGASYDKTGKHLYTATMNPNRGAWLEYETDSNDVFYVRIDKNRKLPVTVLIRALGLGTDVQIREFFGEDERILATLEKDTTTNTEEGLLETYRKLRPGEPPTVESAQTHLNNLFFDPRRYDLSRFGRYKMNKKLALARRIAGFTAARDVVAPLTGELLISAGERITREAAEAAEAAGVSVAYLTIDEKEVKVITNGTVDAQGFFPFDVAACGINEKVSFAELRAILDAGLDEAGQKEMLEKNRDKLISRTVTIDDIFASINYLNGLDHGVGVTDDIDHLGNRRIRSVGELLQNQFRIGFSRMERVIRERMTLQAQDAGEATPQSLINIRPVVAAIKEFFGSSPLSQFMDQNNPLAELTHKRRLSALGPGGLSRDRAGFEVRDVHYSHYGRMCPIETPEGPNIGLISYLATFAKINEYGFVEAPYRKVDKATGVVTDEVVYMTADVEDEYVVAQANEPLDEQHRFANPRVNVRRREEIMEIEREKVDYMDVSPKQLVSVAAGIIPFLEHDDANRALMGSNMQRQGVPLLKTAAPLVGTGIEGRVATDSRTVVLSESAGKVASVDAKRIIVTSDGEMPKKVQGKIKNDPDKGVYVYELRKFMRSNACTCFTQKPVVKRGQAVKVGTVLADGAATEDGELALGKNVLVAFMPWNGYNFEDAILLSEKLIKNDVFTSIHIEEYEVTARDTKLGPEEITRDIPNVGDEALKNLDRNGVIRVGAEVKPGDILVGKITPKSETELAPEEKLLRAIFGEKAADVKDTSLVVPSGVKGIIMDVKTTTKSDRDNEKISTSDIRRRTRKINEEHRAQTDKLRDDLTEALSNVLLGEKIPLDVRNSETGEVIIQANRKITKTLLRRLAAVSKNIDIDPSPVRIKIMEIVDNYQRRFDEIEKERARKVDSIENGEGSEQNVIKTVKVYIATKRKIQVGDKMAGRHGNKGIVARIVPEEDMPYLPDGTPVEICLNPMGVPSRMNVGQVLETHLGWACKKLGIKVATPIFDGISEKDIRKYLKDSGLPESGKVRLIDGLTGEYFDQDIVVGYIYMMKLNHLVADKIHARAVGPYSLITQQPLGGKAQYGGQRFGEMEVWALEAYGAAYTLQELLTVKSDDVQGRTKIYEQLVKGDSSLQAGTPQSFNVLMKEMQGLCLNIRPENSDALNK